MTSSSLAESSPPVWDASVGAVDHPAFGFLPVNKPAGITTFDIIRRIKRHRRKIKAGHAGTLDPFATGLVILALGKATRQIQHLQQLPKTYRGIIRLGVTTPSLDPDTPPSDHRPIPNLSLDQLHSIARTFEGTIMQVPPAYSALKVKGKRAYDLARAGTPPQLEARPVEVYRFEIERVEGPDVYFVLECGKGTYARALARDFAEKVGTVGMLQQLTRTRIGPFDLEEAWDLDALTEALRSHPQFLR